MDTDHPPRSILRVLGAIILAGLMMGTTMDLVE